MHYGRLLRRFAGLALRRPALLYPLISAAWRFRARGWYRRPPFLPLPPADYVAWRLHTAYGDESAIPPARELGRYLAWSAGFGGRAGSTPAPRRSERSERSGRAERGTNGSSVAGRDRQGP